MVFDFIQENISLLQGMFCLHKSMPKLVLITFGSTDFNLFKWSIAVVVDLILWRSVTRPPAKQGVDQRALKVIAQRDL